MRNNRTRAKPQNTQCPSMETKNKHVSLVDRQLALPRATTFSLCCVCMSAQHAFEVHKEQAAPDELQVRRNGEFARFALRL